MDSRSRARRDSGRSLSSLDRLLLACRRALGRVRRAAGKAGARPIIVFLCTANVLRLRRKPRGSRASPEHRAPLGLQSGDRVRVRSRQEIGLTLDCEGTCPWPGYIPEVMDRFKGGTFSVRGRVERFFDERNQRLMKLRGVVLLDGAFCEPSPDSRSPFAGCSRSCFPSGRRPGWRRSRRLSTCRCGTTGLADRRRRVDAAHGRGGDHAPTWCVTAQSGRSWWSRPAATCSPATST